jgi:ribosomal protein S18 acetylase RimI-like enzyme
MGSNGQVGITVIEDASQIEPYFPGSVSFFSPYLPYFMKEILMIGGEVCVSRDPNHIVSGAFIYDAFERTGTIFTRSTDVFERFYNLRPFGFLFSELKTSSEHETYDIFSLNLDASESGHRFAHEVTVATRNEIEEIDRFMTLTHQGINRKWVRTAFAQGEKCVLVRAGSDIAGLGWVSLVSGIGRLHSLYVKPRFRGLGIGQDIFFARLMWLKSKRATSAFSEISRDNGASMRIAVKGQMRVIGQTFLYLGGAHNYGATSSSAPRTEDTRSP